MTVTAPVIRYHGGKFRLAPWVLRHFPPHRIYCEPFGGAAGVLMQKLRAYSEIYNDLDGEMKRGWGNRGDWNNWFHPVSGWNYDLHDAVVHILMLTPNTQ